MDSLAAITKNFFEIGLKYEVFYKNGPVAGYFVLPEP
jgi:hypothetical protein